MTHIINPKVGILTSTSDVGALLSHSWCPSCVVNKILFEAKENYWNSGLKSQKS